MHFLSAELVSTGFIPDTVFALTRPHAQLEQKPVAIKLVVSAGVSLDQSRWPKNMM